MLHGDLKGGTRRVALSTRAIQILKSLKPRSEQTPWFEVSPRTLSAAVVRARGKLKIKDLRHDSDGLDTGAGVTREILKIYEMLPATLRAIPHLRHATRLDAEAK